MSACQRHTLEYIISIDMQTCTQLEHMYMQSTKEDQGGRNKQQLSCLYYFPTMTGMNHNKSILQSHRKWSGC